MQENISVTDSYSTGNAAQAMLEKLLQIYDVKTLVAQLNGVGENHWSAAILKRALANDSAWHRLSEKEFAHLQTLLPKPPEHHPHYAFRFIDLFAGIGGIRRGFESIGGQCVFTSEWNKHAVRTYKANHYCDPATHHFNEDIRDITLSHQEGVSDEAAAEHIRQHIPEHDVLLAGFPCQPFSLAGVSEDAYISSQRNHLENVANALDKHLQYNVDKLIFLRNGMREALVAPLDFTSLRNAVTEFEQHRDEHAWQIELNRRRTLPVNGVSDALVSEGNLLSRENESLDNEITAALEVGYLLRLAHNSSSMVEQAVYVSRAGFYVSTLPTLFTRNVPTRYYGYVTQPWFIGHSQRENRHRAVRWFTSQPEHASNTEPQVTVSVPVDSNNYWYGVLGMSIPVRTMQQFLKNAIDKNLDGEYQLYDSKLRFLTSSNPDHPTGNIFDPRELALLAQAMEHDTRGGIRMDSRYVSWERLDHFDGVLVRVHTLSEGVRGDFGSISIALTLLWALFTTMLLISWYVIRRMVSNMYVLQSSLQWQAWHDTLTRLYNRGALFEKARPLAKLCQTHQHPFSVIQVDLDHFKAINDRFGHQAGDRVLSHAAGLISSSLRAQDVAGRVGGEEFCVILPGANLTQAAEVAERIRLKLNEKEMLIAKSTTIRISASLGVSSSEETGDYDFEQLQSLADRRLYLAKQAGRNRVFASDNA